MIYRINRSGYDKSIYIKKAPDREYRWWNKIIGRYPDGCYRNEATSRFISDECRILKIETYGYLLVEADEKKMSEFLSAMRVHGGSKHVRFIIETYAEGAIDYDRFIEEMMIHMIAGAIKALGD